MEKHEIVKRIEDTARNILEDCEFDLDSALDQVHETIDGFDWVIYCNESRELVDCVGRAEQNEAFDELKGLGIADTDSLDDLTTKLAFVILETRLRDEIHEQHEQHDAETEDEDEEEDNDITPSRQSFYYEEGGRIDDDEGIPATTIEQAMSLAEGNAITLYDYNLNVYKRWVRQTKNSDWTLVVTT